MRREFSEFRLAVSFLSRLPAGGNGRIGKVPAYFTAVGYLAGTVYFGIRVLVPALPGALLAMAAGFFIFDLFHFDGLLDTLDGFLSQKAKDRKMEIMSKGNVGPSALFYGVLFVAAYAYLLSGTDPVYALYAAVFGRLSMNFTMDFSDPAKETGLGRAFYPYDRTNTFSALAFTVPLVLLPWAYVLSMGISAALARVFSKISSREIGGYTGDTLGFTNMAVQLAVLAGIFILKG